MEVFMVGEVVVGQNFEIDTEYNGLEAVVVEGLCMREWHYPDTGEEGASMAYVVQWVTGEETTQEPYQLRRRKPPTTGEESIIAMFRTTPKREGAPA